MMNKKGFTMVELLAVVVLLGVLAAIAMPTVQKYIGEARTRYNNQLENQLVIAGKAYFSDNRNLLPKLTYNDRVSMKEEAESNVTSSELMTRNYLKNELKDYDGATCNDSYVIVVKKSTSEEEFWYPCLICGEGSEKKPLSTNDYCS